MKVSATKFYIAALIIFLFLQAVVSAQVKSPYELKEDEIVKIRKIDDKKLPARFNFDRPFLVSINRTIPNVTAIKNELVNQLASNGTLDNVVFSWFGSEQSESIELAIGNRVPVEMAQAVIKALSHQENLQLIVSVRKEDIIVQDNHRFFFGYTQRITIGSLIKSKKKPLSKEKIDALLREGITQKEFLKLLAETK